jgi:hypothetical protein
MGGFFKRGEIVTIDGGEKRWSVDLIREARDRDGEPFQMADLSDDSGGTTSAATERLTKVGG